MLPGELLLEGGDLAGTSGVLRGVVLLRVGGVCAGWARLLSEAFLDEVRRRRPGLRMPLWLSSFGLLVLWGKRTEDFVSCLPKCFSG